MFKKCVARLLRLFVRRNGLALNMDLEQKKRMTAGFLE